MHMRPRGWGPCAGLPPLQSPCLTPVTFFVTTACPAWRDVCVISTRSAGGVCVCMCLGTLPPSAGRAARPPPRHGVKGCLQRRGQGSTGTLTPGSHVSVCSVCTVCVCVGGEVSILTGACPACSPIEARPSLPLPVGLRPDRWAEGPTLETL